MARLKWNSFSERYLIEMSQSTTSVEGEHRYQYQKRFVPNHTDTVRRHLKMTAPKLIISQLFGLLSAAAVFVCL